MLQPLVVDIINFASAEGARILITGDLIRLAFGGKASCVRFLDSMTESHPTVSPCFVSGEFDKVDFNYTPKLCACA